MGLTITRAISENHRGPITLTSSHGEGTTATATLPDADVVSRPLMSARRTGLGT
ncbi:signal transduction histidine kinase [Pseudarthrobacter sp. SLBN-100]|uniref:hypothetical protein n=1 Tax=Arthrobacter sp. SLBN-100 TaxID=2768450 RepID=UPI00190F18B2|nr:hypothetical protein [Arthrobacter sp. SLBN-100]